LVVVMAVPGVLVVRVVAAATVAPVVRAATARRVPTALLGWLGLSRAATVKPVVLAVREGPGAPAGPSPGAVGSVGLVDRVRAVVTVGSGSLVRMRAPLVGRGVMAVPVVMAGVAVTVVTAGLAGWPLMARPPLRVPVVMPGAAAMGPPPAMAAPVRPAAH